MVDFDSPLLFALVTAAVAFAVAFALGALGFGDPVADAALRAAAIAVGVGFGAFVVRRVTAESSRQT